MHQMRRYNNTYGTRRGPQTADKSYYKSPLKHEHDTAGRCHSLAAESVQAVRRRKREDCHPP